MKFRKVKKLGYKEIQPFQFVFGKIVLGYFNIIPGYIIPFEICHTNHRFIAIYSFIDYFGSSMFMNRIMKLVLNGGKKLPCHIRTRVIINGSGINIRYLLVKITFGSPDITDTLQ